MDHVTDLMQVVDWSRAQFAMTAMYHWIFVPLTLGLGVIVALMETFYYRTGDEFWKRTTRFWMKLFGINFAIGIATGLILEFEFGTNWSNYSYFVGDIFGAPLAIEGIMAFFLESTFIAVMFFGWDKVSKGFHLTATWLTAIGASLSALWILVANAWMQNPVGTRFNVETARNEMDDFWAIIFSDVAVNKFSHTVFSAFVLSAVFVVGISAWFLLKKRDVIMAKKSMTIAAVFGLVASVCLAYTGDSSGRIVARVQPMKLAAMEAQYEGEHGAPLVVLGALRDMDEITGNDNAFHFKMEIPKMLSLMSFRQSDAFVPGINDLVWGNEQQGLMPASEKIERGRVAIEQLRLYKDAKADGNKEMMAAVVGNFDPDTEQGQYFLNNYYKYFGYGYLSEPTDIVPNIPLLFYSFRVMVALGLFFIALFAVVLWLLYKDKIEKPRWLLWTAVWSIPLAYIAGQAGWVVAEVGRQPWTIQDLLPTVASASRIEYQSVMVTFILFAVLFTVLLIAEISIMVKQIKKGA